MGSPQMHTHLSRGAAAALLGMTLAGAAHAQVIRKDSVIVRTGGAGEKMDSIVVLMRKLEREEPGTEMFTIITRNLDSLVGGVARKSVMLRVPRIPEGLMPKGYLGLNFNGPRKLEVDSTGQRLTYFAHPLIVSVEPESPAERAGVLPGDVLLAFDGIDVVGHEFNMNKLFVPERKLGLAVRRDNERKEYSITLGRAPERMALRMAVPEPPEPPRGGTFRRVPGAPAAPTMRPEGRMRTPLLPGGIFIMSPNGVLGAQLSAVSADLAKTLHIAPGVLVNDVPESSPLFTSGLRVGDIITAVAGQSITSMEELHALFGAHMNMHEVPLRVVREKKSRDVTVRW